MHWSPHTPTQIAPIFLNPSGYIPINNFIHEYQYYIFTCLFDISSASEILFCFTVHGYYDKDEIYRLFLFYYWLNCQNFMLTRSNIFSIKNLFLV